MNTTKSNTEFSFPGLASQTNRFQTVVLNLTFFGILLVCFAIFVLGPVYGIYKRGWEPMMYPALTGWGVALLILIPSFNYIFRRKQIACKIIVDNNGLLFYNSKHEITDQILYTALQASNQSFDIYTVTSAGRSIIPLLEVTVKSEKKENIQRRIDMNLPLHVVKNKFTLYAHFMHGITIFRPDLKIDPMALKSFSIAPDTWKITPKGTSFGGWFVIMAAFVITGIICGFVFLLSR